MNSTPSHVIIYNSPLAWAFWQDPVGVLLFAGMVIVSLVVGLFVFFLVEWAGERLALASKKKQHFTTYKPWTIYRYRTPGWVKTLAGLAGFAATYYMFKFLEYLQF